MTATERLDGQDLAPHATKLNTWRATAICGNDITSSCLYVSALAILWAGPWAPLSLLLVSAVLWLFKGIYAEVVGALPLNGGAYNALLNTTSKFRASIAACFTILSYLATAVISASEAVHYGADAVRVLGGQSIEHSHIFWITILVLGVFALLTIRGIGESSSVALGIFIFHIFSLLLLLSVGGVYLLQNGLSVFETNLSTPPPKPSSTPLLFGFFVAMLGISGFESSSNFVEEQREGVFPKTLRNMWIAVTFFNPLICLLALSVIPMAEVDGNKEALLAHIGFITGGKWLSLLIDVNAALVLCGAVLTSFIGVTGLVHRMTLDRCLPQMFLHLGRYNTFYRIILAFFLLSTFLLYFAGDVHGLAGVYTISFLSVMFLFAVGNGLLKVYRGRLPREEKVGWVTVILAATAVLVGLAGNIHLHAEYIKVFLAYFLPTLFTIIIMLKRTVLLTVSIYIMRRVSTAIGRTTRHVTGVLEDKLEEINSQTMVFFTRGDNIANLNQAMLYVKNNEHTNRIKVVTVVENSEEVPDSLATDLDFLDKAYPDITIEFVVHKGQFSPELLKKLSSAWSIPLNFMFIGSPGQKFSHNLADLGGVRLIV